MFQGETAITIDDKGRLAIPTAYREFVARDCGNRLVVTYHPYERGSLWLYPQAEWEKVRDQVNQLPVAVSSTSTVFLSRRAMRSSSLINAWAIPWRRTFW